jgi:hypothetical protein
VSPAARRFGLIVGGAAALARDDGSCAASEAIPTDWRKRRRCMAGILSRGDAEW